jgi:hypothetical protein
MLIGNGNDNGYRGHHPTAGFRSHSDVAARGGFQCPYPRRGGGGYTGGSRRWTVSGTKRSRLYWPKRALRTKASPSTTQEQRGGDSNGSIQHTQQPLQGGAPAMQQAEGANDSGKMATQVKPTLFRPIWWPCSSNFWLPWQRMMKEKEQGRRRSRRTAQKLKLLRKFPRRIKRNRLHRGEA